MRKFIFYYEESKLFYRLSGSKSRCSISRKSFILFNDGEQKDPKKLNVFFKRFCKVCRKVIEIVLSLGVIAKLALLIMNWLDW